MNRIAITASDGMELERVKAILSWIVDIGRIRRGADGNRKAIG